MEPGNQVLNNGKINAVLIKITPEHNTKTLNYVLIVGWQIFFNFFLIYKFPDTQQIHLLKTINTKKKHTERMLLQ